MGRDLRMVPKGWEHPRYTVYDAPFSTLVGQYRPCHDSTLEEAQAKWDREREQWKQGVHRDQIEFADVVSKFGRTYVEWAGERPTGEYDTYRPAFESEPNHYQIYENVTEGTPVSPIFESREELIEHLVTVGTWYDGPYTMKAAQNIVNNGYNPTMRYQRDDGLEGPDGQQIEIYRRER